MHTIVNYIYEFPCQLFLRRIYAILKYAGIMAQEAEWLCSLSDKMSMFNNIIIITIKNYNKCFIK